jgi:hypothetical protein
MKLRQRNSRRELRLKDDIPMRGRSVTILGTEVGNSIVSLDLARERRDKARRAAVATIVPNIASSLMQHAARWDATGVPCATGSTVRPYHLIRGGLLLLGASRKEKTP